MNRQPKSPMPDWTCPDIDNLIEGLEELRETNALLRSWVEFWEAEVQVLTKDMGDTERALEAINTDLRGQVNELLGEVADLQRALAEWSEK